MAVKVRLKPCFRHSATQTRDKSSEVVLRPVLSALQLSMSGQIIYATPISVTSYRNWSDMVLNDTGSHYFSFRLHKRR